MVPRESLAGDHSRRRGSPAWAEVAAIGYIVATMTELITVAPPVAVALGVAAAAALVVRRLALAKRGSDD